MTFKDCLVRFFKDEEGASGIEYALIAVMCAVVLTAFTGTISGGVDGIFQSIDDAITAAP